MLNVIEARKIADRKCIEMFGKEFCDQYAEFGGSSYDIQDNSLKVFYGMNDEMPDLPNGLCLTEMKYKYILILSVDRVNGEISVEKSILPNN